MVVEGILRKSASDPRCAAFEGLTLVKGGGGGHWGVRFLVAAGIDCAEAGDWWCRACSKKASRGRRPAGRYPGLRCHFAFDQADGVVGLFGDGLVVGDHDDGEAVVAVKFFEEGEDFSAGFLVEVAGGLVSEEEFGIGDQRAGDGGALHFAAGKFAGFVRQPMAELHHVEQLLGPLNVLAFVPPITEDAVANHDGGEDVFERREFRQEVIELKDHAEMLIAQVIA